MSDIAIEESKLGKLISSVPEVVSASIIALATFPAAFISVASGNLRIVCICITALILIVGISLSVLKYDRDKRVTTKREGNYEVDLARVEKENREYLMAILDEFGLAGFTVGDGLIEKAPKQLNAQMNLVRHSLLVQVRNLVGVQGDFKVVANLFAVDSVEPPMLTSKVWGKAGGIGEPSDRVFRPGDKTYDLSIQKLDRLVKDVSELPSEEKPSRGYGCFATYPVATNGRLYGILTVDAPNPNDLGEIDRKILGVFASLISITFEVDKEMKSIQRTTPAEVCDTGDASEQPNVEGEHHE